MKVSMQSNSFELTTELEKYARGKLAVVLKRLPRPLRQAASCQLSFTQKRSKNTKFNTCAVVLCVNGTELRAEETTLHMYAALDIAVVHIDQALKDSLSRSYRQTARAILRRQLSADWQIPHA